MKNITKQYQDLLEGKMSKANFMVNVRRDFPQWISPVNSFQDAVNILKSKRILTEADAGSHSGPIGGETQAGARHIAKMWDSLSDQAREDIIQTAGTFHDWEDVERLAGMDFDAMMAAMPPGQGSINKLYDAIKQAAEDESMVSQMASKQDYFDPAFPGRDIEVPADRAMEETITLEPELEKVLGQLDKEQKKDLIFWLKDKLTGKKSEPTSKIDPHDPYGSGLPIGSSMFQVTEKDTLKEATEKPEGRYKEATGKVEYDKFAEMDRVHYRQLMKGMEYELLKMPEISDENLVKAKKKAYSNLVKNPKYYMHLLINNEKDVEKKDKDLRMQPVKGDNKVDKANAMKVIKKDEGSNTQDSLGNKEKAKGKPEGVKEMPDKGVTGTEKVLRESLVAQLKEEIMDEMVELGTPKKNFSKGQKVETPDGKVGTALEESPDSTVTVEIEEGGKKYEKHYQANVLKKHEGEQVQEAGQSDESTFENLMKRYDWYAEMSDDSRKWDAQQAMERELKQIAKIIGAEKAAEIWNKYAPANRKVDANYFLKEVAEKVEDKHAALKEKLVKDLEEAGILQTQSGVTVGSGKNDSQLKNTGKAIEKNTGKQLKFINPDTGAEQQV